ncbi:hypothetical protein AVEN_166913-1 [Araneus ventricosus]|uniref:Uncharacterized protein n=1 Tax=Araneus ventricosus TaxID=182803 RepID=A0A4Y1ZV08_ARAVE|nr:hypothetical protein AVEN_166913-1 [Araneus ventricosus]
MNPNGERRRSKLQNNLPPLPRNRFLSRKSGVKKQLFLPLTQTGYGLKVNTALAGREPTERKKDVLFFLTLTQVAISLAVYELQFVLRRQIQANNTILKLSHF